MLPISSFPRRFATMKGRAKTALGLRSVHLGARSLPKPKAKPKSDAKAGISSSANHQSGASAQATATSSRFSRAEIEELQAMLQKAVLVADQMPNFIVRG